MQSSKMMIETKSVETMTQDKRSTQITLVPAQGGRRGTVLFSHGLRSTPRYYVHLFNAWSQAGYEVLAPLHVDSIDYPDYESIPLDASWPARLHDMRAAAEVADAKRFVAAGHSYGALLALTLGGATPTAPPGFTAQTLSDPRAVAALSLSPPGVIPGVFAPESYRTLAVPTLVQTGDRDSFAPEIPWQSHLIPYDQAPSGNKYALVLDQVDHGFGGLIYDPIMFALADQQAQLGAMLRLSVLFMNAFGGGDADAKARLDLAVGTSGFVHLNRK